MRGKTLKGDFKPSLPHGGMNNTTIRASFFEDRALFNMQFRAGMKVNWLYFVTTLIAALSMASPVSA